MDYKDSQVHPVNQDLQDPKDNQDHQDHRDQEESQDHAEKTVKQVPLEVLDSEDRMESQDHKVHKVPRAHRDQRDQEVNLARGENLGCQDQPEMQELQVKIHNTFFKQKTYLKFKLFILIIKGEMSRLTGQYFL